MTAQTVQNALVIATRRLKDADVPGAAQDARRLMAWALNTEPSRLTLVMPDVLTPAVATEFEAAVAARKTRRPVSHIIGQRDFYGRVFKVTPDVLDPRPETETLVEAALSFDFVSVLDLGTGSGAILVSLLAERPEAGGLGIDVSEKALDVARENAGTFLSGQKINFRKSDWFAGVTETFDLIVSNPPYITSAEMSGLSPEVRLYEPHIALTPDPGNENDGLAAYRRIAGAAATHLNAGGKVMVEIGYLQGEVVAGLFENAGFSAVKILKDLNKHDRVVVASSPGR